MRLHNNLEESATGAHSPTLGYLLLNGLKIIFVTMAINILGRLTMIHFALNYPLNYFC